MYRVLGLLLFCGVEAWDLQGHQLIALLAGNLIKKETNEFLRKHLGPKHAHRSVARAMAHQSSWADFVTHDPADGYEWSKDLHFAYTEYPDCSPFEVNAGCRDGRCIVTAIANYTMRAGDRKLSSDERMEAVNFLIHFMGDVHQPLHIGFLRDQGGTTLHLLDPPTSLHNVWDATLLGWYLQKKSNGQLNYYDLARELYEKEGEKLKKSDSKIKFTREQVSNPDSILKQIILIASETVSTVTCPLAYKHVSGKWIGPNDKLTDKYMQSRSEAMIRQYLLAGIRLASLLDAIVERFNAVDKPIVVPKSSNAFSLLNNSDCSSDEEEEAPCVQSTTTTTVKPQEKKKKDDFDLIIDEFKASKPKIGNTKKLSVSV
jgi:hypothetical protein